MKPRNRDIQIFNLSMLDVISGAMGAFLIVMVVLLPAYKNQAPQGDSSALQEQNESLRRQIDDLQQRLAEAQREQRQPAPQQQRQTEEPFVHFNGFPLGENPGFLKCGLRTEPTSAMTGSDVTYRPGQAMGVIGQNAFLVVRPRPGRYIYLCELESGPAQVTVLSETHWQRGGFRESRVAIPLGQERAISVVQVSPNGGVQPLN